MGEERGGRVWANKLIIRQCQQVSRCFSIARMKKRRSLDEIVITVEFVYDPRMGNLISLFLGTSPSPHMSDATVSDHPSCTDVGDRILAAGGNAVDAAVAASFCLAAVAPHMTGLGGGGVMLVHK